MRFRVVASLTLLAATAALAAPLTKPVALRIMHERHEGMEAVGTTNKVLRREITADEPNLATIRASANQMAGLAAKSAHWFPQGTGPDLGKTGAKPEIWQKPADFSAKLHDFQAASRELQLTAARGDLTGIKASYAKLGGTCKACHDAYRSDMHH